MVLLEKLEDAKEIAEVRAMIQRHADYTKSERAAKVLENWEQFVLKFVRVIPKDYKRILQTVKEMEASGLSGEEALMAAFEVNAKDVSRVGGS
jgi:glutamate synthase (ferredoxin)